MPDTRRIRLACWAVLAAAMAASATFHMLLGRGRTFMADDVYYYAHYVVHGFGTEPGHGAEYFLAPHNSHLQVGGKLIYSLMFSLFGADYGPFRALELFAILVAVGLFYVFARRRLGPVLALAPAFLLLFLGFAYEVFLWPFDLHTAFALCFGLGAVLAYEREDRLGDVLTCLLLVLAVAMIELGLAFVVGIGLLIVLERRWRRLWIVAVPIVLYAIWWLWARKFDQEGIKLTNVHLIPADFTDALSSVMGSIFGLNPTGAEANVYLAGITTAGTVLAAIFVIALIVRARQGPLPRLFYFFGAVLLFYWLTIAMGGRPPDTPRYIFAGTMLVLLIAAFAAPWGRYSLAVLAGAFVLVGLAIPPNVAKLYDGRSLGINDARATRVEYAMLELARANVDPGYTPGSDPEVTERGGGIFAPLPAGEYFRAASEVGPLGYSLAEIGEQSLMYREIADLVLARADQLEPQPTSAPADQSNCVNSTEGSAEEAAFLELPSRGAVLRPLTAQPVEVSVARFAKDGPGIPIGSVQPGEWAKVSAPEDSSPDQWRASFDAPLRICRLEG